MKEKFRNLADCGKFTEYKILTEMTYHPNVVQLYDAFLSSSNELYFVMEYMEVGNLYQLINERKRLGSLIEPNELRSILYQMIDALSHIHYHEQLFHRDIKPENILLSYTGDGSLTLKLADFGLAKHLNSKPPFTDYVSTRWYRAPEVLLKSTNYSYPIDLWAVGAIFAELITLDPLFPGQSEIDQLHCICNILGSPGIIVKKKKSKIDLLSSSTVYISPSSTIGLGGEWKEGLKLAKKLGFEFPLVSS
ncbi:kinase-like domain-containing protein [Sporodiniella umbellata]|nr:kinase-like domain-containing protein [Sporodiniella umbellata]